MLQITSDNLIKLDHEATRLNIKFILPNLNTQPLITTHKHTNTQTHTQTQTIREWKLIGNYNHSDQSRPSFLKLKL